MNLIPSSSYEDDKPSSHSDLNESFSTSPEKLRALEALSPKIMNTVTDFVKKNPGEFLSVTISIYEIDDKKKDVYLIFQQKELQYNEEREDKITDIDIELTRAHEGVYFHVRNVPPMIEPDNFLSFCVQEEMLERTVISCERLELGGLELGGLELEE